MTLEEPQFWTRQLPILFFAAVFAAGVICCKFDLLARLVPAKFRIGGVLGGLAGLAAMVMISAAFEPDKAELFIYSERPAEVEVFMDGRPIRLKDLSGASAVPLSTEGPNVLEVREGGEAVVKQAVAKERYAVNCSATRPVACMRITYTTDRVAAYLPSAPDTRYLFQGMGRGIRKIEIPEKDALLEFSEKPPLSLPALTQRKDPDKHLTRYGWWLHAE
ncbi:MAG TPA: hypothetical protein VGE29_10155 [Prosthecobacter sp.]